MQPDHDRLDDAVALPTAGIVRAFSGGEIAALTLETLTGTRTMLAHLASSRAGRALVESVLARWEQAQIPVRLTTDGRRTEMSGGGARVYLDVLAII